MNDNDDYLRGGMTWAQRIEHEVKNNPRIRCQQSGGRHHIERFDYDYSGHAGLCDHCGITVQWEGIWWKEHTYIIEGPP